MNEEKEEYLKTLCFNISNRKNYVIFVKEIDSFITSKVGEVIDNKIFIPRLNSYFHVIPISDNMPNYRCYKALIDSRISLDDIKEKIYPLLIYCNYCMYF